MNLNRSLMVFALIVGLCSPLTSIGAQDQSNVSDTEAAAIKKSVADFYESFTRHDAHGTAMTFAEDADFTNMFGIHIRGRKAIEDRFAVLFNGALKAAHRTDTVKMIRSYSPQVVAVDAETVITGTISADGSEIPVRKGLMVLVMTKVNGRWQISNFHEAEYPGNRAAIAPPPAD